MRFRSSSTGEKDEGKKSGLPLRMPTLRRKQRPQTRGRTDAEASAPVEEKIPEDDEDAALDQIRAMTFNGAESSPRPSRRKTVLDFFRNRSMDKDGKATDERPPTRSTTLRAPRGVRRDH